MKWLKAAIDRSGGEGAVARAAQMSESHLRNIVRGDRNLTGGVVKKLRKVLTDIPDEQWLRGMCQRRQFTAAEARA